MSVYKIEVGSYEPKQVLFNLRQDKPEMMEENQLGRTSHRQSHTLKCRTLPGEHDPTHEEQCTLTIWVVGVLPIVAVLLQGRRETPPGGWCDLATFLLDRVAKLEELLIRSRLGLETLPIPEIVAHW